MKLSQLAAEYVTFKQSLGMRFRTESVPSFPAMNSHLSPDRSPWLHSSRPSMHSVTKPWRTLSSLLRRPPSVTGSLLSFPGLDFTLNPQARRYARPNRVRPPTDCMFASGCFPPRPTATQFPSAIRSGHLLREDFTLQSHLLAGARIPAFAGMTTFWKPLVYKQTLNSKVDVLL